MQTEPNAPQTTRAGSRRQKTEWDSSHFSFQPLLDRGKFINIVKSDRSDGKTTQMIDRICTRFKRKEGKFILLRRYKEEADTEYKNSLLDAVHKFGRHTDLEVTCNKDRIYFNKEFAGWIMPLSTTVGKKSRNYDEADELYYDEAFLLPGQGLHYIPNEATLLLEFFTTVFRDRKGNKAFLFGNNITFTDPISMAWGITPSDKEFSYWAMSGASNRNICQWLKHNEALAETHAAGDMGQLIGGTKYGAYAFGNKHLYGNEDFIAPRPRNSEFRFAIRYRGEYFGFWSDLQEGRLYVSRKYDGTSHMLFSLTREDHTINTHLMACKGHAFYRIMAEYYSAGDMRFVDAYCKTKGLEILSYFFK